MHRGKHAQNWYNIGIEQLHFQLVEGSQQQNILGVALKENSVEFQPIALTFDVCVRRFTEHENLVQQTKL